MNDALVEKVVKAIEDELGGYADCPHDIVIKAAKAAIQASGVMEMREALEAIIDFNNAPLEERRPDVFILLLRKAARALSNKDT